MVQDTASAAGAQEEDPTRYDFGELARGTRSESADGDAKVTCETYYWGYELYLNRYAFNKFVELGSGFMGTIVANLPYPVNLIVGAHLLTRTAWAIAVNKGTGVKFTSWWPVAGALVPSAWHDGEDTRPTRSG
ncbi:hypothetical protein [Streptomyces sp. t39]|uniref:hypothetical protein n=1 Tax=Streptomyces sp. t39 TaxID=1828156 RepID=UPI0011CE6599|nr:hypothetical protein [Streptomyces sp. t39]TXS35201.1 hypothetical protein EAO77_37500 [Streptomyces sp. t39]